MIQGQFCQIKAEKERKGRRELCPEISFSHQLHFSVEDTGEIRCLSYRHVGKEGEMDR